MTSWPADATHGRSDPKSLVVETLHLIWDSKNGFIKQTGYCK